MDSVLNLGYSKIPECVFGTIRKCS